MGSLILSPLTVFIALITQVAIQAQVQAATYEPLSSESPHSALSSYPYPYPYPYPNPNPSTNHSSSPTPTHILTSTHTSISISTSPCPTNQTSPNPNVTIITPELDSFINQLMERYSIPGFSVALVSQDGEEVKSYGVRDIAGSRLTTDTYFALASDSKLITSLAIGLMINDNITLPNGEYLSLETKMKDIIPNFKMMDQNSTDTVRLVDLMSMRSGLAQHVYQHTPGETLSHALSQLPYLKSTLPIGQVQYSNINYVILSIIPEILLNKTLEEFVKERIFIPLGMSNGAGYNAAIASENGPRLQGFMRGLVNMTECNTAVEAGNAKLTDEICIGEPVAFDFWTPEGSDGSELFGGGSVITTSDDILKWVRELIHPDTIIPPSVLDRAQTAIDYPIPSTSATDETTPMILGTCQLGMFSQSYRNETRYLHDGAVPGGLSLFIRVPERNIGIFLITNDDKLGIPFLNVIANTVIDSLLGLQSIDWEQMLLATPPPTLTPPSPPANGVSASDGFDGTTFSDRVYGKITLKSIDINDPVSLEGVTFPVDWYTQTLVPSLGLQLTTNSNNTANGTVSTVPMYWAEWPHSLATHFVFSHFDGPFFNYTMLAVRKRVYPEMGINVTSPSEGPTAEYYVAKSFHVGTAVFGEEGVGLFGDMINSGFTVNPVPSIEGIKDAPVFFSRT